MDNNKCTSIGGQAVLEGVMMRGDNSIATAVRTPMGDITVESYRVKSSKEKKGMAKVPVVRGLIAFGSSMIVGVKTLISSSEVFGEQEEPSKFELWLAKKLKIDIMDIIIAIAMVLGVGLSVGLFFVLPQALGTWIFSIPEIADAHSIVKNLVSGVMRLFIFIIYIGVVGFMPDIKRVFMYHGAEHKTINCYESGKELTVDNIMRSSKEHSRCGTTYLLIIMVVSVLVFSLLGWSDNFWLRLLLRLLLLPVVAGISYEILKIFAKYENWFTRIMRKPGLWLQKLTTREPDEKIVEVALTAFNTVLAMDADSTIPNQNFVKYVTYKEARKTIDKIVGIKAEIADVDWCFVEILGILRSELVDIKVIKKSELDQIEAMAHRLATGEPFAYIVGNVNFYGYTLSVNKSVLIPRPETELLVEQALIYIRDDSKVLDICTGSGAIAIVMSKEKGISVDAGDISLEAIAIARANAESVGADVTVYETDLFSAFNDKQYDVITINPPYIKTSEIELLEKNVWSYEPHIALDGGEDGYDFYRKIADSIDSVLAIGGVLLMECGVGQSKVISELLNNKLEVSIIKDYNNVDRIVVGKRKQYV